MNNIFVIPQGPVYKISDYGFHILQDLATSNKDKQFHKAPELMQDQHRTISKESDIFAFGVLLFRVQTKEVPFSVKDLLQSSRNDVELEKLEGSIFKELVSQMLNWEPDQRPSVDEILEHDFVTEFLDKRISQYEKCNQNQALEYFKIACQLGYMDFADKILTDFKSLLFQNLSLDSNHPILSVPKGHDNDSGRKIVFNKMLKMKPNEKDALLTLSDNKGQNCLWLSVKFGHFQLTQSILQNLNKDNLHSQDCGQTSLIWNASDDGHSALVKLLLDKGFSDPEAPDGSTGIIRAVEQNHKEVLEVFWQHARKV